MKPSTLTPEQFLKWRRSLGMNHTSAAKRLGISVSSISNYEAGEREGRKVYIPVLVALGMSAISNNLKPYDGEQQ